MAPAANGAAAQWRLLISDTRNPSLPPSLPQHLSSLGLSAAQLERLLRDDPTLAVPAAPERVRQVVSFLAGKGLSREDLAQMLLKVPRVSARSVRSMPRRDALHHSAHTPARPHTPLGLAALMEHPSTLFSNHAPPQPFTLTCTAIFFLLSPTQVTQYSHAALQIKWQFMEEALGGSSADIAACPYYLEASLANVLGGFAVPGMCGFRLCGERRGSLNLLN